jgi:hypothetical protein
VRDRERERQRGMDMERRQCAVHLYVGSDDNDNFLVACLRRGEKKKRKNERKHTVG